MRRVYTIVTAVTKNWMRSRSGVFFSILFPVMLLLIFAAVFGGQGTSEFLLYVQNLDHTSAGAATELSDTFVNVLNQTNAFDLRDVPPDVDGREFVQDEEGTFGGTFRLLIIPSGFQSDLLNGTLRSQLRVTSITIENFLEQAGEFLPPEQVETIQRGLEELRNAIGRIPSRNTTLIYVADPTNTGSTIVQSIVDNVAQSFNLEIIGAQTSVRTETETVAEERFSAIDYYVPGLIGAFVMTNGIIGVTTNTTEFKRRGILKRFATTPLRRVEWVLGNVLSQTLLAFLLVGVMIGVAWLAFGLQAIPDAVTLILIVVGAIMFSGIGLILSGLITDVEAASAAGNAIAFPMMFLSGSFWPLEVMPGYLQDIARVLPLTYFADGLRATLVYSHLPTALNNLSIISVLAVIFIVLGALSTKWHED